MGKKRSNVQSFKKSIEYVRTFLVNSFWSHRKTFLANTQQYHNRAQIGEKVEYKEYDNCV